MASEDLSDVPVESPPDLSSHDQQEMASPLLTNTTKLESDRHRSSEDSAAIVHFNLECKIKDVLKTRPSIRMASRHKIILSPLQSPLHDKDAFSTRHNSVPTSGMRSSAKTLPDAVVRRRQLQKTTFLSSRSLGSEGIPLQRRNNRSEGSVDVTLAATSADTSRLPADGQSYDTSIVVQDVELERSFGEGEINTLQRKSELQKSTLHLKHRMMKR